MITYRKISKAKKYSYVIKLIPDKKREAAIRRFLFLSSFKVFRVNRRERRKNENNKNMMLNIIDANCAWKAGYTIHSRLVMTASGLSSGQISFISQKKQSAWNHREMTLSRDHK